MTIFDFVVLAFVGLAAVGGFMRGFVQEVASLAAWVLSVLAIRYLHQDLTAGLEPMVGSQTSSAILAFAMLLLIPYAGMKLIASAASKSTKNSVLGPIDRVLGFGFGMVKGVIIVVIGFSVLVLGFDQAWGNRGRPLWILEARSYSFVDAASKAMVRMVAQRRAALVESQAADSQG